MRSRNIWMAAALLYFVAMQVLLYQAAVWGRAAEGWPPFAIKTTYALIHSGFGAVLPGAIARLALHAGAGLWRPWMLVDGALSMIAGMWLQSGIGGPPLTLDSAWSACSDSPSWRCCHDGFLRLSRAAGWG